MEVTMEDNPGLIGFYARISLCAPRLAFRIENSDLVSEYSLRVEKSNLSINFCIFIHLKLFIFCLCYTCKVGIYYMALIFLLFSCQTCKMSSYISISCQTHLDARNLSEHQLGTWVQHRNIGKRLFECDELFYLHISAVLLSPLHWISSITSIEEFIQSCFSPLKQFMHTYVIISSIRNLSFLSCAFD